MKMKSVKAGLMTAAATLFSASAFAEGIDTKIGFIVPANDPLATTFQVMAEELEATAPGVFEIAVFPNGSLFKQGQQISALSRGNLEIGNVNMGELSERVPAASVLNAGYVVRDIEHYCAILNSEFGQQILSDIEEEYNIKILDQVLVGYRTMVLREAQDVQVPEDCPSSYKMGHQSGLSIGGSGSFV